MRRKFELELIIHSDGTTNHSQCINHCLLYAFGECSEAHYIRCTKCDEFFVLFEQLLQVLPNNYHQTIADYKERLTYFLAHQARKAYLNRQFKAELAKLDEKGALMIADYKMKILEKRTRETKSQFFGKRGYALHSILVFTKGNGAIAEVRAFDHWSLDTKQDAWFTASSFDAVFEMLNPKPEWIKIFSDNGGHYHNSEMMAVIANWYQWYFIEVRGWYFFEPGEAKSLVDSHHAAVSQSMQCLL